jgi:hypothetical protein
VTDVLRPRPRHPPRKRLRHPRPASGSDPRGLITGLQRATPPSGNATTLSRSYRTLMLTSGRRSRRAALSRQRGPQAGRRRARQAARPSVCAPTASTVSSRTASTRDSHVILRVLPLLYSETGGWPPGPGIDSCRDRLATRSGSTRTRPSNTSGSRKARISRSWERCRSAWASTWTARA